MQRPLASLLAGLLLLIAVPAIAASSPAELKEVVAALEQGYGKLADLQADFTQRTTISSLKREEKGHGELFLKRGSGGQALFRFDYQRPKQQIVSNGKTVWYYLPENRQVIVSEAANLFAGGNAIALSYLTGLGHLSRDFTVRFAGEGRDKKGNYLLELTPKKPTPAIARLQLTVAAEAVEKYVASGTPQVPFPIVASVLYDQLGNQTLLEFTRVKVNRGVRSDRFNFKVPPGVEIIRQ